VPAGLRRGEPGLKLIAALAGWLLKDPSADFANRQRGNEKVLVVLFAHPRQQ